MGKPNVTSTPKRGPSQGTGKEVFGIRVLRVDVRAFRRELAPLVPHVGAIEEELQISVVPPAASSAHSRVSSPTRRKRPRR